MGVSFKERTEAFDFVSALQEWDDKRERIGTHSSEDDRVKSSTDNEIIVPFQDLSLKEGSKIKLNLKIAAGRADDDDETTEKNTKSVAFVNIGGTGLAPPPSGARRQRGQRKDGC